MPEIQTYNVRFVKSERKKKTVDIGSIQKPFWRIDSSLHYDNLDNFMLTQYEKTRL